METSILTAQRENPVLSPVALEAEWDWLICCFDERRQSPALTGEALSPPPPVLGDCPFAAWLRQGPPPRAERLLLALLTARELKPSVLHLLNDGHTAHEMGLALDRETQTLVPTLRTWLWLLHGDDQASMHATLLRWIQGETFLPKSWINKAPLPGGAPFLSQALSLTREGLFHLVWGIQALPEYSEFFPAQLLHTPLNWSDLVLNIQMEQTLTEVLAWFDYGDKIRHGLGMSKCLRPGFRVLFHGPPGTGKSLTAALIGKKVGKPVYRVDLSGLVSKYIGETEKNLAAVFDRAEQQGWILFFDEADALFGKRGKINDARDRYATQEVSYLLQRIEVFDGVCILATNSKDNLDHAFLRRLEAIVEFPRPRAAERLKIWQNTLPASIPIAAGVHLPFLAEKHELSGGEILNVVRDMVLQAVRRDPPVIDPDIATAALRREFARNERSR